MSEEEKKNTSLVSSGSKSLIARSSGLAKRGLELLSSQQERVIHFPPDRSMGMLSVLDLDNPDSEMELEEISKAQGNITVPMGKYLSLTVSDEAVTDLSYLSKLKPNDLQSLHLPADISYLS